MDRKNEELSDADLELIMGGMGKAAAMAVVNDARPRTPLLRAALTPVRRVVPRSTPGGSCAGGTCSV